ncbi:hypothetical protein K3495_g13286 [Podosphaera aphanis]|nr:hypothetical protein K3495_g13286 [Podosphaera aphanis]
MGDNQDRDNEDRDNENRGHVSEGNDGIQGSYTESITPRPTTDERQRRPTSNSVAYSDGKLGDAGLTAMSKKASTFRDKLILNCMFFTPTEFNDSTLVGCLIQNTMIINCDVQCCTLLKCIVTGSSILSPTTDLQLLGSFYQNCTCKG